MSKTGQRSQNTRAPARMRLLACASMPRNQLIRGAQQMNLRHDPVYFCAVSPYLPFCDILRVAQCFFPAKLTVALSECATFINTHTCARAHTQTLSHGPTLILPVSGGPFEAQERKSAVDRRPSEWQSECQGEHAKCSQQRVAFSFLSVFVKFQLLVPPLPVKNLRN